MLRLSISFNLANHLALSLVKPETFHLQAFTRHLVILSSFAGVSSSHQTIVSLMSGGGHIARCRPLHPVLRGKPRALR